MHAQELQKATGDQICSGGFQCKGPKVNTDKTSFLPSRDNRCLEFIASEVFLSFIIKSRKSFHISKNHHEEELERAEIWKTKHPNVAQSNEI